MIVFISGCEISPQVVVVVVCEDFCSSPLSLTANKDFLGLVQTTFFSGPGRVRVGIFWPRVAVQAAWRFIMANFLPKVIFLSFRLGSRPLKTHGP